MIRNKGKKFTAIIMAIITCFSLIFFHKNTAEAAMGFYGQGYYEIRPTYKKQMRLDVPGASKKNNTNLQIYKTNSTKSQRFYLVEAGGGYYYIVSQVSGKVLDVKGNSKKSGTGVIQHTWKRGKNQQWRFEILSDGSYYIIPRVNQNLALAYSGTKVVVSSKNGDCSQKWQLYQAKKTLEGCTTMSSPKRVSASYDIKVTGNNAKFTVTPLCISSLSTEIYGKTAGKMDVKILSGNKVIKEYTLNGNSITCKIPSGYDNIKVQISAKSGGWASGYNFKNGAVYCQLESLSNCYLER